jgi:uncharacterized membrane protein YdbT with pleckstrin-like domain
MSTDKQAVDEPVEEPVSQPVADEPAADKGDGGEDVGDARPPSWWHRDHPTFAALSGFFTGLLFVALVPAAFYGVLSLVVDNDRAEDLFPFVLVTLVVPIGLVASQRTRRFGTYFWIGMILTAIVVVGVSALVLWYLVENQN